MRFVFDPCHKIFIKKIVMVITQNKRLFHLKLNTVLLQSLN